MKPFMRNKGYALYTEIWDDQPPLFTVILSTAFKQFGPTILTARSVTAVFGVILLAAFYELIRRRSGTWCALLAIFFLLASPGVLLLSVSVTQEVPAMAMALVSAWLVSRWEKQRHWAWLIASGVAMALAMQIKMTAVLVTPAILLELVLSSLAKAPHPAKRDTVIRLLFWSAGLIAVFTVIGLTWGKGSFEIAWKAHTGSQTVLGMNSPDDYKFEPKLLWLHIECVIATVMCVVLALQRKRFREISFPIILLLTDSFVHAVHSPWWNY